MSAERWSVALGCPTCGDALCEPLTSCNDHAHTFTPQMSVQRAVRCTECAAEFLLTVELAPVRMTKNNGGDLTAPRQRTAPAGRSIHEEPRTAA